MPPSSARRGKTRKIETVEKSDGDDPELLMTPSRKRRKVQQEPPAGAAEAAPSGPAEQPASNTRRRQQRLSDISQGHATAEEIAEEVIRQFRTAKGSIQARIDHANEKHEVLYPGGKTAYAKLSGADWTYYVTDIIVRIGRPPDEKLEAGNGVPQPHIKEDNSTVHVDLGPSKLVSRQHAEIKYDDDCWTISVIGRNGIKLDDLPLARGETRTIKSGSVIEVAGTQMMFVTPGQSPIISDRILASINDLQDDEDETGAKFRAPRPPAQRTPGRGPSSAGRQLGSRDQYDYQDSGKGNGYGRGHAHAGSMNDATGDIGSSATKSPGYARGLLIDTSEDVDYSQDGARDIKPPHSYAQLIGMAILSNEEEKVTLAKIYDFIKDRYAFYRFSGGGWQNSIRHNLSLNKCFEKVARRTDEPGKGMKWQIVPEHRGEFMKRSFMNPRGKAIWSTSSEPNSPLKDIPSSAGFGDSKSMDNPFSSQLRSGKSARLGRPLIKPSSRSTSPVGAYPVPGAVETPDRNAVFNGFSSPAGMRGTGSPLPAAAGRGRQSLLGLNEIAASRTPGGPIFHASQNGSDHFATPLFARQKPNLGPPSTAHVPSHYMPMSSPAPFWKYANEFVSSPVKANLASPVKLVAKLKGQNVKGEEKAQEAILGNGHEAIETQSSSPSGREGQDGGLDSPIRLATNRGLTQRKGSVPEAKAAQQLRPFQASKQGPGACGRISPSKYYSLEGKDDGDQGQVQEDQVEQEEEEEEEEEQEPIIDLAKGFQPIGSFHHALHPAAAIRGN